MSEIPIKSLAERADARTSGRNLTSVYSGFLKRDMETLTPIRFVVYGKPRVLVKDVLIGRAYQSTLVKLQHCLLSNSDTMEAMRAVGIVCGSWGKHRSGISGSIVVLIQDFGVGIEHMNRMFDLRRSTRPKCRASGIWFEYQSLDHRGTRRATLGCCQRRAGYYLLLRLPIDAGGEM